MVPGHEIVGVVEAVGSEVRGRPAPVQYLSVACTKVDKCLCMYVNTKPHTMQVTKFKVGDKAGVGVFVDSW